ncbi:MAG: Flp pilus assembly complex ATPase component TadA [Candidatus Sericytochromatia bacterium]|nr:Flp pilus assembly complex ATPase component TadA [Candidatus Tanganyikabacteria bacterium]
MQLAEQNDYLSRLLLKTGRLSPQQVAAATEAGLADQGLPLARLLVESKQIRPEGAQDIVQHQLRLAEGEALLGLVAITEAHLEAAMVAAEGNQSLCSVLIKQGVLRGGDVRDLAHRFAARPFEEITREHFDAIFLDLVPRAVAQRYQMIALVRIGDRLVVATPRPNDINALDDLRILTGYKPVPVEISEEQFEEFWEQARQAPARAGGGNADFADVDLEIQKEDVEDLATTDVEEAPVILLVNEILGNAIATGVSDIHIEPKDRYMLVRYRKDGILHDVTRVPKASQNPVLARLKIMSNLNVSERRLPQDGKVRVKVGDFHVDLRVSTMPSQYGEKIVVRVLNSQASLRPIDDLGLTERQREDLLRILRNPQGILFVTGPTGSGKTTTLYSALGHIQSRAKNIITIEDPIEYNFEHATQVQVNPNIDLTFARVLRAVLRQDPDVVLIGETRDQETAKIALEAAMTGHLVLSSLHTNDATSSITRLEEMGLEPYLVGSALLGAVAQRLVRQICPDCKEDYRGSPEILHELGLPEDAHLYRGAGCDKCHHTGYVGRRGIYEVFSLAQNTRELILKGTPSNLVRMQAQKDGMLTMRQHAIELVADGATTFEEFVRVVYADASGHEMLCPRCKNVIEEEFATCPFCKYALNPSCPSCQFNVKAEWSVCPKCGEALMMDKRVCRSCMAELETSWLRCPFCYFEDGSG